MTEVDNGLQPASDGPRPIFVAIGGDSGSGKSTLAAGFYRIFGDARVTTVCLDDYHSLDRRQRKLVGFTALDPRANNFALMEDQLLSLKRGRAIRKPVYDHRDGTFGPPETIDPGDVVIVQGLHPLLVPGIRALFGLRVWLDPEDELKHRWKVQRDVAKRGYTAEQVRTEIELRQSDVDAYVTPQRRFADMVVRFYRPDGRDDEHLGVRITTRPSLPRIDLQGILDRPRAGLRIREQGGDEITEIDGDIDRQTVTQLEDRIWDHIDQKHRYLRHLAPDQFGTFTDQRLRERHSDPLALTQLLLVHRILAAQRWMLLRVPVRVHDQLVDDEGSCFPIDEPSWRGHEHP